MSYDEGQRVVGVCCLCHKYIYAHDQTDTYKKKHTEHTVHASCLKKQQAIDSGEIEDKAKEHRKKVLIGAIFGLAAALVLAVIITLVVVLS